jgi:hypothetical protein
MPPTPPAADHAPNARGPLRSVGEAGVDHSECGRGQHRAAETLRGTGADQDLRCGRQAGGQARQGEQAEPGDQHAALAEQIRRAAAQQHKTGERQHVTIDYPGQPGVGESEIALHRRQRDVHDRHVQDDHELASAHQREDQPGRAGVRLDRPGFGTGTRHDFLLLSRGSGGLGHARSERGALESESE